jgi:hypothetical protein
MVNPFLNSTRTSGAPSSAPENSSTATRSGAANTSNAAANPMDPLDGAPAVAGGLAHTASTAGAGVIIKALAAQEPSDVKTLEMLSKPSKVTSVSVSYKMGGPSGRKLAPGEQMLLEIPPQFRGRPIRFAVLKHRQDSSETISPEPGEKWDEKPGVTSLQVHSTEHQGSESWRYWKAPWGSSGEAGGKYAEHRSSSDPEVENMFDWIQHGHAAAGGSFGKSHDPLMADAIKVASVGKDPVRVHQVDMMFLPERPDSTDELIFSPGTLFGDAWTGAGRKYGGGPRFKGKYPEALKLGSYTSQAATPGGEGADKLNDKEGWAMNGSQLEIELDPSKIFTGIEIACGDTHPDGKRNKDGHTGTLGWSRISVGVQRKDSTKVDWFIEGQGVPPEGVLFGGPTLENYQAQAGDKLVVKASSDTTYVMGARLWYKD